ncbi:MULTISPECIES: SWIM zinc finger family protein [unclassified Streptomyces]|uniref:SWIM zinc finger family protein n=1 Tax=unclassified Streptomyces TaxID=2593676 RepID=UPI0029B3C907|nr:MULTISPECIES: SWIM zinc finger family protein [unclassified Streptomyces]MDX3772038.1 SWIM zinc finger family protein [Streptomyces sp. AK08-01B]MDX3821563.1 SWIM zinc finger family protein [Streptomyces sp. AK08-01A]
MSRPKKADDGRTRTFPPLPATRGRRSFAESWWGNAWVEALEGKQRLATGRLARGRTYARGGNVGEITVTPGRVAARVQGSRPAPYRTSMDIPQLSPRDWELLLDTAAGQAGHIAALLDRDMPTTLVDDAARAGVRLLPRQGELTPNCSCPDWGYPCKHAAAVFYQVARLLDHDPFVLLLLRGRGERELMDELQRRNAVQAAAEDTSPQALAPAGPLGVPARDVFATARAGIAPLPAPPPEADRPAQVASFATAGDPAPELDPSALQFLAADTATRAARLLRQIALSHDIPHQPTGPANLTAAEDLVRLAAAAPPSEVFARLCQHAGRTPQALTRTVRAWRQGGAAALPVLDDAWDPDPSQLNLAREAIKQAWEGEQPPGLRTAHNRLTVIGRDAQLRLGTDGRWYPYRKEQGGWWPAGPADRDVTAVLAGLLAGPDITPPPHPAPRARRAAPR